MKNLLNQKFGEMNVKKENQKKSIRKNVKKIKYGLFRFIINSLTFCWLYFWMERNKKCVKEDKIKILVYQIFMLNI